MLSLWGQKSNLINQDIIDLVASFDSIMVPWDRFLLCHTFQTWFSNFLRKYHLHWGLLDHMIKGFALVGIRARLQNQVISFLFSLSIFFVSVSLCLSLFCFGLVFVYFLMLFCVYCILFWVQNKGSNQKMLFGLR